MKERYDSRILIFWVVLGIIIIVILSFPIKIPKNIKITGKLLPAKEWIISKGNDGRLMTDLIDNIQGINSQYSYQLFERGDNIRFDLTDGIQSGSKINQGDTVGNLFSYTTTKKLVELEGEIKLAIAELEIYKTGEKQPIIDEAEELIKLAEVEAELQRNILQRQSRLKEKEFIADEEYEVAVTQSKINELQIDIARSRLNVYRTGAKQEEINFIQTKINKLQADLDVVESVINSFNVVSPINGSAIHILSGDTLLYVADNQNYLVLIPVKWYQRSKINLPQSISVNIRGNEHIADAELVKIIESGYMLNGEPVFLGIALLDVNSNGLMAHMPVKCTIKHDDLVLREIIFSFINKIFTHLL